MKVKQFLLSLFALALFAKSYAQAPLGIPYQAAARKANGQVLANTAIKVRFSILDSIYTGTVVFKETHTTNTNALGMFTLNVGMGTAITGTLSGVNWGNNAKFLQVELDTTATGNNYSFMGVQQLMSVPYALFSGNVIGMVNAFAGANIPPGWLLCDGSEISRADYSSLFKVVGTIWGEGDGLTTFNLPDLRGQFLRGVSGSSSNDPDAGSRTAKKSGGNTGNNVGSFQDDDFKYHNHQINTIINNTNGNSGVALTGGGPSSSNNTQNKGGNETRPKNANVYFIIKY